MDEYVLPKFEVKLDAKPASAADRFLTVRVDAKYTFGGAVQGRATITVSRPQNIWWGGPVLVGPVLADAAVDGAIIAKDNIMLKRSSLRRRRVSAAKLNETEFWLKTNFLFKNATSLQSRLRLPSSRRVTRLNRITRTTPSIRANRII